MTVALSTRRLNAARRAAPRVPSWRVMRRTHGMLLMTSCCLLPLTSAAQTANPDVRNAACSRRHFFIMFSMRPPATSDFHQVSFSVFIASLLRYHQPCVQRNASYFIITTRRDLISPTRYLPVCFLHPDDARLRDRPPSHPRTARSPVYDCISTHKSRCPLPSRESGHVHSRLLPDSKAVHPLLLH